jgi:hypothetical protein
VVPAHKDKPQPTLDDVAANRRNWSRRAPTRRSTRPARPRARNMEVTAAAGRRQHVFDGLDTLHRSTAPGTASESPSQADPPWRRSRRGRQNNATE